QGQGDPGALRRRWGHRLTRRCWSSLRVTWNPDRARKCGPGAPRAYGNLAVETGVSGAKFQVVTSTQDSHERQPGQHLLERDGKAQPPCAASANVRQSVRLASSILKSL